MKTVAFLGPTGTYTHQAAHTKFGDEVEYIEQNTISNVFNALSRVDFAVVPLENTIFGSVVETYDALRSLPESAVCGEITIEIQHSLLVRKGTTRDNVKYIMSHEQALGQCSHFLARDFPNASLRKTTSTASAARDLLNRSNDCAAICSSVCATIYPELEVMQTSIQNERNNFTRFGVLAATPLVLEASSHALLRVLLEKETALNGLLRKIDQQIVRLDRRPSLGQVPFQDVYFIEIVGSKAEVAVTMTILRAGGWDAVVLGLW